MDKPPYWVLESDSFHPPDFLRARDLVEERFGLELFHDVMPHFGNPGGYTGCIDMRDSEAVSSVISNPRMMSNNCTILADAITLCSEKLAQLAETIILHNPFTCIQLVVLSDERIREAVFLRASDLFFRPDQYIERIHSFDDDNQGRFGTRVFQLTRDIGLLRTLTDESSFVDPVLLYGKGSLVELETFLTDAKPLIVIDSSVPEREYNELRRIYAEYSEYLIVSGRIIE
jgi:hypothetical protein